ncbi:cell wall-associated NlpC family hydrolase [Sinorhizobium fredii]|jgi:cell wall-associated NlpC family hydrolase|uniref:NlpC/P60 family protein n=1 Tax=Sinorhizobium fredii (strain USDA 257) TaxID=1185652 RepID=I3XF26_SINF2|nr:MULTISPECIES: NlpC/P60 family protein [Sinorhizobium]AFL54482.1 NlpC/P60 family protein [Sinorhizobium fredii USDA 257]PDT80111.1 peptidase P60 [Sinorhizobium sp. BJ1]
MPELLDRRLNAYRADLAEERLRGLVEAKRFVDGTPATVSVPVATLRARPDLAGGTETELLYGETARILDVADGWAWVKSDLDGYVGYVPRDAVGEPGAPATHIVAVPRTFVYRGADLRFPQAFALSMGSRLNVVGEAETRGTRYFLLDGGLAVVTNHCAPAGGPIGDDYVAIATRFLETPYLWGGRSGFGIDCSGLVQLAMQMTGRQAPRDTDMQAAIGQPIGRDDLSRGDLVFWKGHVAIMEDDKSLVHANGYTMTVAREGLDDAIRRIGWLYGEPTGYRRP